MTTQLPPQGPPEPDEKLPGEAELATLYRQLPQNEPGPALDAAVLRAAAQALAADAQPAWSIRKTRPRWLIGLSSAATLVLAAGLAWHMRELPPAESAPTSADSVVPAQAAAPAPRAAPASAPIPPAEPASPMPAVPPPPRMVVAKSPTPTVTAQRKAAADRQVARASSKGYAVTALPQPAPASVTTLAAPPMMAPQVASDSAANAAMAEAAPVATPSHVRARMPVAPAPFAAAADMDTASYASDTPAQELNKIRQLFALGHDDEARQRLSAFHLAHPRWDLPLDLQAQLRKP
jgi:hypothetical protein